MFWVGITLGVSNVVPLEGSSTVVGSTALVGSGVVDEDSSTGVVVDDDHAVEDEGPADGRAASEATLPSAEVAGVEGAAAAASARTAEGVALLSKEAADIRSFNAFR